MIFDEGYEAYWNDSKCPYPMGSQDGNTWLEGYEDARREVEDIPLRQ